MTDQARRSAARRYEKAVDDLRHARQRYVDAQVPMSPARPRPQDWNSPTQPPTWTAEQRHAVKAYANAWYWLGQVVDEWERLTGQGQPS
jgi:hypothetical protein